MPKNDSLSAKQAKFVQELLAGADVARAAKATGVSVRTGWNWLKLPAVDAELSEGRRIILASVVNSLVSDAEWARQTLRDLLDSPRDSVRLGAADKLLHYATQWQSLADIERRLSELEERQNATIIDQNA